MSLNQMVININNQTDLLHDCEATGIETSSRTEKISITETEFTEKTSQNKQGISSEKKLTKNYLCKNYLTSIIPEEFVYEEAADVSVYRLQHDIIKRMTLVVFGTYHFDKLLTLCRSEELKSWVKEKNMMSIVAQGEIKPFL